jgi:hypothetical protein
MVREVRLKGMPFGEVFSFRSHETCPATQRTAHLGDPRDLIEKPLQPPWRVGVRLFQRAGLFSLNEPETANKAPA